MISPTPTSSAPDWPSFGPSAQGSNASSNGTRAQASPFVPSIASPPPHQLPNRPWGPTGLGGEALYGSSGRRATNLTDPIGSRPGSRLDERGMPTSPSPSPLGNPENKAQSAFLNASNSNVHRPRASAAAAVAAAASSAAARSRAASPSNTSAAYFDLFPSNNGGGFMSFGSTSLLPNSNNRFDMSGTGMQTPDGQAFNSMRSPGRGAAGTPTLVVDNVEGGVSRTGTEEKQSTIDAWATGLEAAAAGRRSPSTDNMTASFSALMSNASDNFPFGPGNTSTPPKPLRSNTDSSLMSNQGTWNNGPQRGLHTPFYANTGSAAASTSSLQPQASGLLSPSAAAGGPQQQISSTAASLGSKSLSNSQISLPQHTAVSPPALPPGMQSNSMFGPMNLNAPRDATQNNSSMASDIEAQLRMSPLFGEVVERLNRHENSVRELNRTIQTLNRNISLLLERTKHMPPQQLGHQNNRAMSTPQPHHPHHLAGMGAAHTEEVRAMAAQLNAVSATISQLMAKTGVQPMNGGAMGNGVMQPHNPLTGLGLGQNASHAGSNAATPQMNNMSAAGSGFLPPQPVGPFPVMPSFQNNGLPPNPRFNAGVGNIDTSIRQPSADRNSRLSPRPGVHSPNPNGRRWREMNAGGADGQVPTGAMQPPDPSVIVTKWEHLNLHPDLLRSILRYGLGPPNKIQQRALPFLLRGSDIIAQAPPTQERIASYIIPVLQLVLNINRGEAPLPPSMGVRGPMALIISTTVDQATQAQRMAMGLGAALGIRVHIAAAAGLDVAQDASALIQTQPQIVVGTPQKMMDLFNYLANKTKGAISLDDIRIAVLDEVDQLIARNLADHVSTLLRILPSPRVVQSAAQPSAAARAVSPGVPASSSTGSLTSPAGSASTDQALGGINVTTTDRQTAIFSNTVPQDVLNFAQSIHLRESVRVLVRREGGGASVQPAFSTQSGTGSASSGAAANGADKAGLAGTQPVNALGASPANNHMDPLSDPVLASLRGLRQYYLYVAVTMGSNASGSGGASQAAHANEMKLDVISDMLEDMEFGQAIIYTSSSATQEAVTYKLASKGVEALSLHRDMASTTRQQVLSKYRSGSTDAPGQNYQAAGQAVVGGPGAPTPSALSSSNGSNAGRKKALVVHDFVVSPKDVQQVPLIVFYDLPRSVDEYKDKIAVAAAGGGRAPASAPGTSGGDAAAQTTRPSVCVNVVTGSGGPRGDIEMLRTLECHLGCKMAELPMNPGQILQL